MNIVEPISLIGRSESLKKIRKKINRIAKYDATVLITGETGVGKEIVAKRIHHLSNRKDNNFVPINVGAIPDNLLESELFGYEKGAFTGATQRKVGKLEIADNGSFFMDEIGELPHHLQVKLLRAIQNQTFQRLGSVETIQVDVRFIASTNRDLEEMIKKKRFREDLYFRINVISIKIPPLRERKEDIPVLVRYFFKNKMGYLPKIDKEVFIYLKSFNWYGNVRELINNLTRISIFLENEKHVKLSNVKPYVKTADLKNPGKKNDEKFWGQPYKKAVKSFKKKYIISMLKKNNWIQTKTANEMGIQPSYLSRLISKYNIKRE
ncbi:MAG: sigma-54-dependent Fis family transcriptional regulator [Candidatus Mcinerneyibacterium aminivorans]|uniref:Sigma-54-dependent Fis family transcriptional regulator n=1 Tax=Candidatus Mcinerneyibacterium aminivorans TaxID=2703815 RepID=A0A5D0MIC2_9BACT|nr:MAG: sigma-54-dependent Fis family transcriptional regulator [Candidatus Mcinerneyibacterium aminivorans]